jgi:hypothetical protein
MPDRPLLLLDVDGPLNPYHAKVIPAGFELHDIREGERTWRLLLNQQHGVELTALAARFQLVWATTWEDGANRLIAPRLGLPGNLPVISWPADARHRTSRRVRSWKTPYIAQWVGSRPFVWIDDEVNRYDRYYLKAVDGIGPHLVHRVEANRGLASADFGAVWAWLRKSFA